MFDDIVYFRIYVNKMLKLNRSVHVFKERKIKARDCLEDKFESILYFKPFHFEK
jgi:hypothetical protein